MKAEKILIVDDEADIALVLKLQLEDAGYATDRARDGMEALELLRRKKYALMLLDIKMPQMDGMQVLEQVQRDHQDVTVVMMTAHGSEDIAVEAMKIGAVDYIAKPFSSDDLLKRVVRAIELSRTRRENLRLQQQLDEERKKMAAVLQGMPELLFAVDNRGRIITVNSKAETVIGLQREQLTGKILSTVLKTDLAPERLPSTLVLQTGKPRIDTAYNLLVGGKIIPVLSSATPLFHGDGRLAGCVEIIRDISTLRALEQEKEDFVSMLSHDLKSPITAIVGSLDLVREGRLGQVNHEQLEYLESAIESCGEMVEMIDTLLDIHKFDAGKMVLAIRPEDIAVLVQKTVARYRSTAHRAKLRLNLFFEEGLPQVAIDRNKVTRLIANLLSNAFKFTPEQGEIAVCLEVVKDFAAIRGCVPDATYDPSALPEKGEFLQILVRDSGVGIPADALGTIFDRFVQAKNRRMGKTKGTGLGLAYCRKVMDAHKGFIWAESIEGQGSIFHILFPLKDGLFSKDRPSIPTEYPAVDKAVAAAEQR
jgi:two-component system, OmpR family, phosphate regulon sensor histidine kinase PhoR